MSRVYFGNWSDRAEMFKEFEQEPLDVEILFASYDTYSYEGSALVVFRNNGVLFSVHGGHCSCYGLEGQWNPETFHIATTEHILEKGDLWELELSNADPETKVAFKNLLKELKEQGYE